MPIRISKPSHQSLYVETYAFGEKISNATAFVARSGCGRNFLVTNRHVVTGRDNETGEHLSRTTLAEPDRIVVWHNSKGNLGHFIPVETQLIVDERPQWVEHASYKGEVDVVAIPLPIRDDIDVFAYDVDALAHGTIEPTHVVSIVGFPFGERTGASFAIWSTGFVASEPEIFHKGHPYFLVDCRSRKGQSGSPVIRYQNGGGNFQHNHGSKILSSHTKFLGVYSGRINPESDLGTVWHAWLLAELLAHACTADAA